MPVSKAQQKAVNKYVKDNYDRVLVTMPKGQKEIIRAHAEGLGESVNGFLNRAAQETMERDKAASKASSEATESIPLHTLEQRVRRTLYKHGATIRKDRKGGGYTVVFESGSRSFPDFDALMAYAKSLEK